MMYRKDELRESRINISRANALGFLTIAPARGGVLDFGSVVPHCSAFMKVLSLISQVLGWAVLTVTGVFDLDFFRNFFVPWLLSAPAVPFLRLVKPNTL